ncbi:MBL fold metallo-hydrolase [Desulfoluna spongiiphila]|uniref:7,8-dihydropterin-6-yl-methyl-4-(Beta-D-ribofuranosyl)aminobenzene 5'-phosphate synthase n=1 Tax=Desulfoluna spongiiphila TaxID=419481 RepID=A0A1G5IKP8_9BACT|nr:MBL fold metallo-hydrolase [Desulfoluna spongiiphila]SCY76139.1 7,8-dihydropterin-6-yl-methyl-4-(beta-D-ribofuranosyl)aminobenzene 5'-phosphate synthase [Desulfoluna spongiiphila]
MKVSITTLVENSLGENTQLEAEHGLSFYIEAGEASFLFDTGSTEMFLRNAKRLGIRTEAVDSVFISHGHYDHSGGYKAFVEHAGKRATNLFVRPGFFNRKYGFRVTGEAFLGNAFSKEEISGAGVAVHEIEGDAKEVFPGVYSVTGFERTCPFEHINQRFVVERNGGREVDDFSEEQVLVMKTMKGLVVVLGCSHPGVVNILEKVKHVFDEPIHAVIGGTHLVEADPARIERTTDYLLEQKIPHVMICHCSGGPEHLKGLISRMGDVYRPVHTGTVLTF